uniref:Succinate dehydrogenase subunit 4, mitochondrial n=1 Tax=Ananas comosus var. bracteatus TaxID=296719 RepID=A0A6V7PJJ2_ANACO|nr:unnamed protein product [Ananas comosus var. bracteatus]
MRVETLSFARSEDDDDDDDDDHGVPSPDDPIQNPNPPPPPLLLLLLLLLPLLLFGPDRSPPPLLPSPPILLLLLRRRCRSRRRIRSAVPFPYARFLSEPSLSPPKILENKLTSPFYSFTSSYDSARVLPRNFSVKAQSGAVMNQKENIDSQTVIKPAVGGESDRLSNKKDGGSPKVMAFSPLEGAVIKARESGLSFESLKVRRYELSQKITYALIPALLLVSRTDVLTSLLVFSVYWQIHGCFKEIFLDYVHHEVTRNWVLIYFAMLLVILAKDTIVFFNLV